MLSKKGASLPISNTTNPNRNLEIDPVLNARLHASDQAPVALDPTEREFYRATEPGRSSRAMAIKRARRANKQAPAKLED